MTAEAPKPSETEALIQALKLNANAMLISGRDVLPHDLAAVYCGISESWLLDLARDMKILNTRNGKIRYFKKSNLDAWMYGLEQEP